MHFIHEILCFEEFLHKIALFFKNLIFPDFWSIKPVSRPIEIAIKFFCLNLPDSISSRSMLDRLKMKNFQFPSLWPNFFFHASFMFRIHMHCIDFLYPSCSFAVISLVVFTHNMHTLCKIGYLTWFKNWLINFLCYVLFSICYFYVWTAENIFLDMMNNQCANIFSTHAIVYGSHSVMFAFIERENIFFMCILNLVFKFGLCLFIFPTS